MGSFFRFSGKTHAWLQSFLTFFKVFCEASFVSESFEGFELALRFSLVDHTLYHTCDTSVYCASSTLSQNSDRVEMLQRTVARITASRNMAVGGTTDVSHTSVSTITERCSERDKRAGSTAQRSQTICGEMPTAAR